MCVYIIYYAYYLFLGIMARLDADDPEVEEVKLTYSLTTPGIKVNEYKN